METTLKKVMAKVFTILTDDQKLIYKQMVGKPFEMNMPRGPGGPPPGGPGGLGGPGDF